MSVYLENGMVLHEDTDFENFNGQSQYRHVDGISLLMWFFYGCYHSGSTGFVMVCYDFPAGWQELCRFIQSYGFCVGKVKYFKEW